MPRVGSFPMLVVDDDDGGGGGDDDVVVVQNAFKVDANLWLALHSSKSVSTTKEIY